jgi:uncharacterized protein
METRVRIPVTERVPVKEGPRHRVRFRRRAVAAGRVLVAMLVCLATWVLLNADTLKRSSEGSPPGTRRDASLAVLRPASALSHALLIDRLGDLIQRALGRNPEAAPGAGSTIVTIGAKPSLHPTAPSGRATPSVGPGRHPSPRPGQSPTAHPGRVTLPPLRVPTKDDPLRVLVVGDSFATDIGYGLARAFNTHVVSLTLHGVISSGLSRPDFYPWPQKLQQDVDKLNPEVVVIMIGGNDFHSVLLPNGQNISFAPGKAWRSAYIFRVTQFLQGAAAGATRVAWVGLPIMGNKGYSKDVERFNSVYSQVAEGFKNVVYIDSWDLFANKQGKYAAYLPDANGDLQPVRTADNIHLTPQGNDRLAAYTITVMKGAWRLPRKAIAGG